jgi:hypothetical protein
VSQLLIGMEFRASNVGLCLCFAALVYFYLKVSELLYVWCRAHFMLRKLPRPSGTGIVGVPMEALTPRRHVLFAGVNLEPTSTDIVFEAYGPTLHIAVSCRFTPIRPYMESAAGRGSSRD